MSLARSRRFVFPLVMVLGAGFNGFAQQRELKPGFNLFSKQQDIQLGQEGAKQIERQVRIVDQGDLNDFVVRVGRKLAAQPQADKYPYSFKVIADKSINAFALPGGPAYVHTGLLAAADNEAQLAGVLAHEIAHVALRHGTNQASKANLIQLPAMVAGAVVGSGSIVGQLAQLGIGFGAGSVLLKYSRNAERDADLLGARVMSQAGYNPIEMARFFEKLEAETGQRGGISQFFSDHPNPGNRTKAVEQEIRYLPRRDYDADSGELARMKEVVKSIKESPRAPEPVSAAAIPRPSSNFKSFRSRAFIVGHPDNWETFGDQDAAMVTIAPRGGIGRGRDGSVEVSYGVMISYHFPEDRRAVDLRRDTAELIRRMQRDMPTLRLGRDRTRRVNVDGQSGLLTPLYSESPFRGQTEVDMLLTVARPEGLFYMIFIAPESEFRNIEATFEAMLGSLRFPG